VPAATAPTATFKAPLAIADTQAVNRAVASSSFRLDPPPSRSEAPRAAGRETTPVPVGVEFVIDAAGGESAVVRAASRYLSRLFRDATPLEATEALVFTLVERAPEAIAQLGPAASDAVNQAAAALYRSTVAEPRI
jgi:hypothetical protein